MMYTEQLKAVKQKACSGICVMYRVTVNQPAGWENELALHPCSLTSAGSGPKAMLLTLQPDLLPVNNRNGSYVSNVSVVRGCMSLTVGANAFAQAAAETTYIQSIH